MFRIHLKSLNWIFFLLPLALAAISGCRLSSPVRQELSFLDGNEAQRAFEAFKDKLKEQAVWMVEIREKEFIVRIQDFQNPQKFDEYSYISGEVRKTGSFQIAENEYKFDNAGTFKLDEIDLSSLPQLMRDLQKHSRTKKVRVEQIRVLRRHFTATPEGKLWESAKMEIKFLDGTVSGTTVVEARDGFIDPNDLKIPRYEDPPILPVG